MQYCILGCCLFKLQNFLSDQALLKIQYNAVQSKDFIETTTLTISDFTAREFQHFLPRQIKCRGKYIYENIFSLSTYSSIFLSRLVDIYIKRLGIYLGNFGKNIDEK